MEKYLYTEVKKDGRTFEAKLEQVKVHTLQQEDVPMVGDYTEVSELIYTHKNKQD